MLKRCEKCRWTGEADTRQRRCRQIEQTGFRHRYYCWGRLVAVVRWSTKTASPTPKTASTETASTETAPTPKTASKAKRPQDVAAAKLEQARKRISHWTREIAKATKAIHEWERKARHYARRASMTDAEVEAERERGRTAAAVAKQRKMANKRRGIVIGKEVK